MFALPRSSALRYARRRSRHLDSRPRGAADHSTATALSTAVVIGGARGIGAATTRSLAAQPWVDAVVVADIDLPAAEALASELPSDVVGSARRVDLGEPDSVTRLVEDLGANVEHLVIVAGTSESPRLPLPLEDFQRVIGINLVGAYFAAQAFTQPMMERGRGGVVAIASIAARTPRRLLPAYCASKAGLIMALRVLAMECARAGVRVNTVSPGATETTSNREFLAVTKVDRVAGSLEWARLPIQDGRIATPDDVAAAVTFLLSPSASHITMQDLTVDGGETLGC